MAGTRMTADALEHSASKSRNEWNSGLRRRIFMGGYELVLGNERESKNNAVSGRADDRLNGSIT